MVDPAVVWRDQFAFKEEIVMETPPKSAGFAAPYRLGGTGLCRLDVADSDGHV